MKIKLEKDSPFIPQDLRTYVIKIIKSSLNGIKTTASDFVINDKICFREQRGGKITSCVMNSASYISNAFQNNLAAHKGCQGETKIEGQAFDGLICKDFSGTGYQIKDKDNILKVVHAYVEQNNLPDSSVYTIFPMLYGMYVERSYYDIADLPNKLHPLFKAKKFSCNFKVGIEFETGNVASSFRAINKLYVLFQKGKIDAGVFVTSIDKPGSATRIWPVANRNGSFQELKNRNYEEQISLPLICIGFAPDKFDQSAPYLGKDGRLYHPKDSGGRNSTGEYRVFYGESGEEILIPD